ncbi:MAG: hypothetical protein IJ894_05555, partial [Bacteroidales bacterium]|nr:hypothetical protein [Bacteroidales bacterium]MBR2200199.1 hypothetical protein [Bacteroidales bacterium]
KEQTEPSMDVVIYPDSVANDEVVYAWNFGDGIGEVWMDNTEYQNSFVSPLRPYRYSNPLDMMASLRTQ